MSDEQPVKTDIKQKEFWFSALYPTLVGKTFLLYFGLNYSYSPGEGYGYGLVASILVTVLLAARFIWKNRNYED